MPVVERGEAVEKLANAVERAPASDLAEIYSELFPDRPTPDATGGAAPSLARQIVEYIRHGVEAEEIVDLWNVVFPRDRNMWYDEEDSVFRYDNGAEPRYTE
jgi:hypothetical protein